MAGSTFNRELPIVFECGDDELLGIIHRAAGESRVGVVIVVGGPQYRVGSHRQFLLLARALANAGIPTMRFDHRGMGDSEGEARTFDGIDQDINCAIDTFLQHESAVRTIVLWGLCDAASAILMYAYRDPRVGALVLCNPWVHTEQGEAKVRLKRYYLQRLTSREFWRKAIRGRLDIRDSWRSMINYMKQATERPSSGVPACEGGDGNGDDYIERMRAGLQRFEGRVFLILSGNDITADEFGELSSRAPWSSLCAERVTDTLTLAGANHTFSRAGWRDAVAEKTIAWVRLLDS